MRRLLFLLYGVLVLAPTAECRSRSGINLPFLQNIANFSHASMRNTEEVPVFSPRMDFEQWKPLTGRGDPLRNDPTYDYEPPVLERVHYWADEHRPERDHRPERKSEVLMLGISSKKPSISIRQPPRRHHRPTPLKYEDYSYTLSEHYPMTILVPPPPPPPGHQLPLFINEDEPPPVKKPTTETPIPTLQVKPKPSSLSSLFALEEANLIYQSSTTSQSWASADNKSLVLPSQPITSDYAGWGPTTPTSYENNIYQYDQQNQIFPDYVKSSKYPYSFYKPILSESPPPIQQSEIPFLPTALPTTSQPTTIATTRTNSECEQTMKENSNIKTTASYEEEFTTDSTIINTFRPTTLPPEMPELNALEMMGPMASMPIVSDAQASEESIYSILTNNVKKGKKQPKDTVQIESMLTMQPPPPIKQTEEAMIPQNKPFHLNQFMTKYMSKTPTSNTLDPYLHMRFTTTTTIKPSTPESDRLTTSSTSTTTETPMNPSYLIIQGHSKVKTYNSKPKSVEKDDSFTNEIPNPNETNEVKHLHPIKNKQKTNHDEKNRIKGARSLKALVRDGFGSIEIEEANLGIHYDISDGSDVPIEIYKKGIVDVDENDYAQRKMFKQKRPKRQLQLEDLLPFDEDDVEEYVYNFFESKKNDTGITGVLASVLTSDTGDDLIDDIEQDEDR